jgi:hypothetical protein
MPGIQAETAEGVQHARLHVGTHSPRQGRVLVAIGVRPVHPGDEAVVERRVRLSARTWVGAELLDEDRVTRRDRNPVVGLPSGRVHLIGSVRINMGGVDDPVPGRRVGQVVRADPGEVVGIAQPAREADIVSPSGTDRGQERLHPRAGEIDPAPGPTVPPHRPASGEGFVVEVEYHRRVVGVHRRHRGPESHGIHVGHGLLAGRAPPSTAAGGGGGRGGPRPVEVEIQVTVLGRAIIGDRLNHAPIGSLGHTVATATKPDADGLRGEGDVIGHGNAVDDRRGITRPVVPGVGILEPREIDAAQPQGTTAARGYNLVSGNF